MDIAASQPSLLLVVALSGKCYDGQTELSREKSDVCPVLRRNPIESEEISSCIVVH